MTRPDRPAPNRRVARGLVLAAAGTAVLATVAACTSSAKTTAASVQSPAGPAQGPPGAGQIPGTFGLAAEVSPGVIQVQNPASGQTTVDYTTKTAFTRTETVRASAVRVGECLTAIAARSAGSSSSAPPARPVSITAIAVRITQPVNGSCAAGFGGGGAARPGGRPSGRPSDLPSGTRPPGAGGRGGFATGKVTAMSGSRIAVLATGRQGAAATTQTVIVTAATTYSETVAASSSAVRVGVCIAAVGPANSTGAVSATRIAVSAAVNGTCTGGFGRRGGFGRPTDGSSPSR